MVAPIFKDSARPYIDSLLAPIMSGSVVARVETGGMVDGAAALTVDAQIADGILSFTLGGGSHGEHYDVALEFTSAGDTLRRSLRVIVLDDRWSMADGTPGWLGLIGFVQKFGFEETLRATDQDGSGVIDRAYLVSALRDAQAEAAAHIPPHYTQPLGSVPDILKTAIADIARVRLYPRGVPEGLESAARAQRQLLGRIASGALPLPGVAGVAVASEVEEPILSFTGGRTYPDNLKGF